MQLRALSCRQSLLERADGSCRWKQGETEVLAGVFGPVEPRGGRKEDESKAELKVLFFPATGHQTPESTTYQNYLQNMFQDIILLSLHPKSLIQIVVHVLSDDGSELSACCNAITMALIDAGITIRTIVVSVDIAILENNTIIVDPTRRQVSNQKIETIEKYKADPTTQSKTVSICSFQVTTDGKISSEWSRSVLDTKAINYETYLQCRKLAVEASVKLHHFVKTTTTAKCMYECHGKGY
jgi:exosome complex component RRP46